MAHHYIWKPSPEIVEYSNIGRFMRRHGITSYRELIDRSTSQIEWFWKAAVEDLDIQFFRPFDAVLDASRGIAWTQWFCGGTINLAHQCLDRHALSGRHEHTAVIAEAEDGTTSDLSYGELHAQTCRLADALANLGIRQGDAIGLFLPMIPEAVIGFLACAKLGAIAVPIFSGFGAQAVAARLGDCNAKALLTVETSSRRGHRVDMQAVALEAARACPSVRHVIVSRRPQVDGLERKPHDPAILDWGELVRTASAGRPSAALDPETPVLIAYTSGTTGRPKGAVHVHGGFLVKIAQEVAHQVDMHPDDILFWVTDLGWIMGPWEITGALAAGGTVVLAEGAPDYPAPDRVWSIVERHRVSILGVSPTLIRALARHGQEPLAAHDLSRLRILASTGEAWDPESWRWLFEKAGGKRCPIINISGGTEVGACLLSPLPITPLKPCSLVGPALGMAVDVFDAAGKPLREGVGELVCTRPWPAMTRGIWGDPERYMATYWSRWPDVWVHGDWASIDADGNWFLHGRSDDTLNVAGKRLGPAEIESILAEDDAVAESAAIGVPDQLKGEVIVCFAVLKPGHAASDDLRGALRERVALALGKSFAPADVRFVSELPRTRSGKIVRRVIRRVAIGEDPGDLSSVENLGAIEAIRQETV